MCFFLTKKGAKKHFFCITNQNIIKHSLKCSKSNKILMAPTATAFGSAIVAIDDTISAVIRAIGKAIVTEFSATASTVVLLQQCR